LPTWLASGTTQTPPTPSRSTAPTCEWSVPACSCRLQQPGPTTLTGSIIPCGIMPTHTHITLPPH
jgi:hypothetical protein